MRLRDLIRNRDKLSCTFLPRIISETVKSELIWIIGFSVFLFFFSFFFDASIEYDLSEILEIAELRCTIGKNVNRFGSRIAFQLVSRTSSYAHTAYLSDESEVFHIAL